MQRQPTHSHTSRASNRPSQDSVSRAPHTAAPVVLALTHYGQPAAALQRALALARTCGSELHVLEVFPAFPRVRLHVPRRQFVDAIRSLERFVDASRVTAAWLTRMSGDAKIEYFSVVEGDFSEQVSRYCRHLGAGAIVVSGNEEASGSVVAALACSTGIPVVVARDVGRRTTIVAASDLKDEAYPVLTKAAEMGRGLQAPVVALHNVEPLAVGVSGEPAWSVVVVRPESERRALAAKLLTAARDLHFDSQPVVRHELNPVAAIIDEASARDADLIVVGARMRRRFGLSVFGSVASRVVNRAPCSVLVLPLPPVLEGAAAVDTPAAPAAE